MASIRSTFRSALERMKEDPDFIYSFSAPAVFEWIEQVDPDLFEEIRARVQEGRFAPRAGGCSRTAIFPRAKASFVRGSMDSGISGKNSALPQRPSSTRTASVTAP